MKKTKAQWRRLALKAVKEQVSYPRSKSKFWGWSITEFYLASKAKDYIS